MNVAASDRQQLQTMIRRTMEAIRAGEQLLRRTTILLRQSEQICRARAKLPENDIDQSVR